MGFIRFIQQYIKHPRTVGAVMPSSKQLAKNMVIPISFANANCIIEYGPGTGIFTEELIRNKHSKTILIVIEENKLFYTELKKKYGHMERVHIIHGSAANVKRYLLQHGISKVDYVISGLPFTSLPVKVSKNILKKTAQILGEEGKFITFQYTKIKYNFFHSFFNKIQMKKVYWNIPPAYVFTCSK
ncbi:class I SAM-dependent methyltransferase [Bacillus cereus]|uniref:class I SAM-dependent methyltransferase n=1 Tax=Bacillus cereus TaxID=1396 RepID=UPI00137519A4|nr:rRNA adenine N-6-methyltransferase family protein [Bacillus cereus]